MSSLDLNRRRFLAGAGTTAAVALVGAPGSEWGAAPMLGPVEPKVYRFELGGFEATMIADSNAFVDGPWPLIGGNAERSAVDELMTANLLPANKYQPGFTPMIVNTGKEVVIFDTGNGERGFVPRPKGGWLAKQLEPAGFKPEQIDVVVLSHGHPDHVGGILENGKPLFPNARYATSAVDYDYWSGDRPTGDLAKQAALYRDHVVPMAEKTTFLNPGDEVVPGIRGDRSLRPHAGSSRLRHRERRQAAGVLGRLRAPPSSVAGPARLTLRLRYRQGASREDTRPNVRHGRDRPCRGQRLPYAVSLAGLRRAEKGRRLSLDRAFLPTQGLLARS